MQRARQSSARRQSGNSAPASLTSGVSGRRVGGRSGRVLSCPAALATSRRRCLRAMPVAASRARKRPDWRRRRRASVLVASRPSSWRGRGVEARARPHLRACVHHPRRGLQHFGRKTAPGPLRVRRRGASGVVFALAAIGQFVGLHDSLTLAPPEARRDQRAACRSVGSRRPRAFDGRPDTR
jgi:hypothetical protein